MRIVPMPAHLEPDVRELYAECHPGWAPVPEHWFYANPTLIVLGAPEGYPHNREHGVIGYTSYAMTYGSAGTGIYLQDTCVAPHARGRGIAGLLMQRRLEIARSMGAMLAVGCTQPENEPMQRLLRSFGFKEQQTVPGVYVQATPPADGVIFTLDLQER